MVTFIAHRGDCENYIENTLHSVKAAIEGGVTAIEIDVQLTKDGVPILYHDRDLKRLLNKSGRVGDYSFCELSTSCFSEQQCQRSKNSAESEFITSLAMLVDYLKQWPEVSLFVEIKRINFSFFSYQQVYQVLQEVLLPIKSQVIYISFSYRFIRYCRQRSMMPLGYVLPTWQHVNHKMLARLRPNYLFSSVDIVPESFVFDAQDFHWALYEIVDSDMARQYFDRGVRYLESFNPVRLKREF